MIYIDFAKLDEKIKTAEKNLGSMRKIRKEMSSDFPPNLNLSCVYEKGFVYGIAYDTGHGDIEMLEYVSNRMDVVKAYMEHQLPRFEKLYLVSLKPENIVGVMEE